MSYSIEDIAFENLYSSNDTVNVSDEELLEKVLYTSYFPKEFPPIFTTKKFADVVKVAIKNNSLDASKKKEYTSYYITKNNNSQRRLSIPHPLPYANVCKLLYENWEYLNHKIGENWNGERVSMIIPRNYEYSDRLVPMEYNTKTKNDVIAKLELLQKGKYIVKSDVSKAFPSIYSHSITWAIKGKKQGKEEEKNDDWVNKLDKNVRHLSNNESIGIPISTDLSNVIFELILSCVDKVLIENKYRYIRYIDDFYCVCDTKENAENFIILLSQALKEYNLNINDEKSLILEAPQPIDEKWVIELRKEVFPEIINDKNYKLVIGYLDIAVNFFRENNNASILKFAIKGLQKISIDSLKAYISIEKYIHHITYLYPYILKDLDVFYEINKKYISEDSLSDIIENIIRDSNNLSKSDVLTWAFYIALKYHIELTNITISDVAKINDPVTLVIAHLYYDVFKKTEYCDLIISKAEKHNSWFLSYMLLDKDNLPEEETFLKHLKKKGVSFIDKDLLKKLRKNKLLL